MKKLTTIIASLLLLTMLLPSCSAGLEAPAEETEAPKVSTTKKKADEEKETEPAPIMQDYDPAEDDVINVLMIGNSFCYYYVEELYGIAKAAGVDMKVCNVYYSGCSIKQHWTWWKANEANYQYFETDGSGRKKYENYTLNMCLRQENWDVISIQRGSKDYPSGKKETTYKQLTELLDYIKGQFPQSTYYFHHTWAYQVGYDRNGFKMESAAQQAQSAADKKVTSLEICKDFNLIMVPSGDAWQYARNDKRVGDILCNRGAKSDNYHEGEEGGGQYLNACVWFETITGKSCIGNDWRPGNYKLSESMVTALQQAAHRAVAESRG